MTIKIATWNVNSLRVRLQHVQDWMQANQPDVLALQEIKMPTDDFPIDVFTEMGYHAIVSGQKTYNGVAILSKESAEDVVTDLPGIDDPQRRVLGVTIDDVRVLGIYVPNGQSLDSDKYQYKLNWLKHLDSYMKQQIEKYPRMVVLGDFNIAPDDIDVHDPAKWEGSVLCSEPERKAFQAMLDLGFKDSFREMSPEEKEFSWWDYRMNGFKRNLGLRIDHVLASERLFIRCQNCTIDIEPRTWDRPSDHAPVMAEFDI